MDDLLHFEDFTVGRTFAFGRYEVTKEEIVEFATAFDPQPQHLDEEAAKQSILGGLAASGWHVCSMAMRMFADGMVNRSAAQGGLGIDECRWMRPVRAGDVLRMEVEVLEARVSKSRPQSGIVKFLWRVFNQNEQVASVVTTPLIKRRSA